MTVPHRDAPRADPPPPRAAYQERGLPVEVTVADQDDLVVVTVSGELDMTTVPRLTSVLGDQIGRHPPLLVIDLADVTFMASSGLAALVAARDHAREAQVRVVLRSPSHAVRRPLAATALDTLFEIEDTPA